MFDSSLKYKWDNKNVLDTAVSEAKAEGKLEGRLESKLEGQREMRVEAALKLKKMGLLLQDIAKCTKLSIEEIEKL